MRNMPETVHHDPVYSPARQGSATEALQALIVRNPNRRPVLLKHHRPVRGRSAPRASFPSAWMSGSAYNWSVDAPMTLCRMSERAGAVYVGDARRVGGARKSAEEGVAYLEIRETVDPVRRATLRGVGLARGVPRRQELPARLCWDPTRRATPRCTRRVMEALEEAPRKLDAIESLTDAMEITKSPRRFGQHFIDVLETCDCVIWGDGAWNLNRFGAGYARRAEEREGGLTLWSLWKKPSSRERAASEEREPRRADERPRPILRHAGASVLRRGGSADAARAAEDALSPGHGQCGRR